MKLEPTHHAILLAAIERIVPPDVDASAWKPNMGHLVLQRLESEDSPRTQTLQQGLSALEMESWTVFGAAFTDLHGEQQDEMLERAQDNNVRTRWDCPPQQWVSLLVLLTGEAYQSVGTRLPH